MQKWEHRELTFTDMAIWRRFDVPDETSGISEGAAIIADLGDEGWELVAVVDRITSVSAYSGQPTGSAKSSYFKRPRE